MPILKKIVIQDFRNIELQELGFSPNFNCISGGNGEGKTNLMDAIWYLSMTKSAFSSSDRFNFRHGTSGFSLSGRYLMENGLESVFSISCGTYQDDEANCGKNIRKDGKLYGKASEHIGSIPIVMVSPSDISLVCESSEERRRFVNSVISQIDSQYLSELQQYNKTLSMRNSLLRNGGVDESLLSTYDAMLASHAPVIFERRSRFVESLAPLVKDYYALISGGREEVSVEYRSCMQKAGLEEVLLAHRNADAAMRYTTAGLQRDDFVFTMNGTPIRRFGSQGQQKSFIVALKFAQYEIMKRRCGFPPILLLDDLFDKLDMSRVSNLLEMVAGKEFGQIFITDSNKVRTRTIVDKLTNDRAYFEAAGGAFTRIDELD